MNDKERDHKSRCLEAALYTMILTENLETATDKFNETYKLLVELFIDQINKLSGEGN